MPRTATKLAAVAVALVVSASVAGTAAALNNPPAAPPSPGPLKAIIIWYPGQCPWPGGCPTTTTTATTIPGR
jgi:hypothetical protein